VSTVESGAGQAAVLLSACTDPGQRRSENQDNYLVADLTVASADGGVLLHPDESRGPAVVGALQLGARGLLLAVADGMGGAAGGRVASQLALAWMYRELLMRWDDGTAAGGAPAFVGALRGAIEAANARVHEQGQRNPEYNGMGSTMTAVGLLEGVFYVGQVGDSRAYLLRGGAAYRLTRDQSLVQHLIESGAMTPEEAARSPHGSVLLQALGTSAEVNVDLSWQLAGRDDILLVCSDGLYRVVTDEEIGAAGAVSPDPPTLCRSLVELANARGGPDNVTVVAARLYGDGWAPPSGELPAVQRYTPLEP
jgi:protein phosphatase